MINFDDVIKENIKEHNPNWPEIPDHLYRILIGGEGGGGGVRVGGIGMDLDKQIHYLI